MEMERGSARYQKVGGKVWVGAESLRDQVLEKKADNCC